MKARLPKMLLTALLAAVSTAYAISHVVVDPETGHQYYHWLDDPADPCVLSSYGDFGMGVNDAPQSTVNIGYSLSDGTVYNGYFTLDGKGGTVTYETPNALFIGGPGWPHHLYYPGTQTPTGYAASKGILTLDNGAVLKVSVKNLYDPFANHITMGSCEGAESTLNIQGGSKVYTASIEVSNGGGNAIVNVGATDGSSRGYVELTGDLMVGVNHVGAFDENAMGHVTIYAGSQVNVAGSTSVGYAYFNEDTQQYEGTGGYGEVIIENGGVLNTASLEMGISTVGDIDYSDGGVIVRGTLNVTDNKKDILLGIDGGVGFMLVEKGGVANLGSADIFLGSTVNEGDGTYGEIVVDNGSTINHAGTIYVGDIDPNYGTGALLIRKGATANLQNVEVSTDSLVLVDGNVSVNQNPWGENVNAPGIHLYHNSWVGGAPQVAKGKELVLVSIKEQGDETADIHISAGGETQGLTLTEGTRFEACCDTHMKVGGDANLTFGPGLMHLTNGVLYIDGDSDGAGTIAHLGTGNVSISGNTALESLLPKLIRRDSTSRMGIIDASDFIQNGGLHDTFDPSKGGELKLIDNSAYKVYFTGDESVAVTVINSGYEEGFQGFYIVKEGNPAQDGYYELDRNERTVYRVIDQLDREGAQIPEDLKRAIDAVLNIDGKKNLQELRQALDFLGTVNYSVMMHNQIDGNTSHQRMLRNRSMVGRNLRHRKGCTDVYAAAFFDTQRNNYGFHTGQGYHRTEWGGLVGADTCINQYLRLGADVAFGRARIHPTQNWSMHQNSLYWDVYAQLRKGNWRSITAVGMGIHSFDVNRGLGSLSAKANNVKGYSLNFTEEVSYDWKVSGKTTIQPFAALDLNWNTIKSFTDGDVGSMNMHVKRQRALAADLTVGGRYIHDFALLRNVPDATWYAQLGVTVSLGQRDCDMDCNFVGAPDAPFTIYAAKRDRVGLNLGAGITIPVTDRWAVFANGEAILRGDSHNINAQIGVQVAF